MTQDKSVWRPARVIENRLVANGSMWLALEADDGLAAAFEPGHVLGLGVHLGDDSFVRHAYTVSRGDPPRGSFEHLYRIIPGGRLTPHLAQLSPSDSVFFHGPFHTPIQQEIRSDAEGIVLISTGTGIGPLYGYAAKALSEGERRPMTLCAGFQEHSHTCLAPELKALSDTYPNFDWHFTLTRPPIGWQGLTGRVTECVPDAIDKTRLWSCHFHLVGNGEMVHLMRNALHRAGLPHGRVSIETYFNHHAEPPEGEVDRLSRRFTRDAAGTLARARKARRPRPPTAASQGPSPRD